MAIKTALPERRQFTRDPLSARLAVNLLQPSSLSVNNVNYSEGGLCLRLERALEVKSLVRLQVAAEGAKSLKGRRAVQCVGRVAWVMQRMDLRSMPPFLFDVGIEFVDPSPLLRQLMMSQGSQLAALKEPHTKEKLLESAALHGRQYMPHLEHDGHHAKRWHLVVSVDGVPCFSGHFVSERMALTAWAQFKRQQARR